MPSVTVSELLRFALPAGAYVMAGGGGLSNSVSWARLLRARPASLGRIEHGEVWLLSSAALQLLGDRRATARMIRDMAEAGVVAFITAEPLDGASLAEADQANVPLVLLANAPPLADVEKAIVSFLVDRERAVAQRAQEVYERLLATLVEDHGPELLAEVVHEVTGKAVYLLDEHFQPTVQTGGSAQSAEAVAEVRRRYWEGNLGSVSERLISVRPSTSGRPTSLGLVLRPLTLRGAVEGFLAIVGRADDFGEFDHAVADRAASVLAIELAKQSAVVEARLRVQGDFLQDLLDEPTPPDDNLIERARRLGYDLSRPHLIFVLRTREDQRNPRFIDLARRRLVLTDLTTLLREREGTIQVLMPCPTEVQLDDTASAVDWVERFRAALEGGLMPERVGIVAGIGRSPDGEVTTHYSAVREAARAAEIAASLSNGPATLHFARLGALRLIFHLAGNPELRAFQRDVLGPLEISDSTRRSEFVRTLEAFLQAGGNHMRAARGLHVHRNTLLYRLERIRELLGGADLENPETRLNLQLALKIRAALGGST
jgi:purine catabolism regulator